MSDRSAFARLPRVTRLPRQWLAQLAFVLALVLVAAGFSLPRGALAISASAQQVVVIDVESTDILF
ncbi:MAG: hypothetical protein ACPG4D_10180, partial [Alphaproteobacteria bacterium]